MIKKLKWKFVAVNMILVSSVLLIVFSILLYTNYARAQKESEEVMRNTLMRDFSMEPPKFAIGSKEHHNSISEIQLLPVFWFAWMMIGMCCPYGRITLRSPTRFWTMRLPESVRKRKR